MKTRHLLNSEYSDRNQAIMQFGQAQLVRNPAGNLELQGATAEEQTAAKEYISLFMHEAVVSFTE